MEIASGQNAGFAGVGETLRNQLRAFWSTRKSPRRALFLFAVSAMSLSATSTTGMGGTQAASDDSLAKTLNLAMAWKKWPFADSQFTSTRPTSLAELADVRAAPPFIYALGADDRSRAIDCLASAAWYEAGNDPEGQRAVIQVVLNRVRHRAFPKSICGVVFEGSERVTGCQFSFTCDGSRRRRTPSASAWSSAQALAAKAMNGSVDQAVGQATHYHADYVTPWWSGYMQPVAKVGLHIFYVWPGETDHLSGARGITTSERGMPALTASMAGEEGNANADVAGLALAKPEPNGGIAMSGNLARHVAEAGVRSTMFMAVDQASANGRWAVSAMNQCAGRDSCLVLGYTSPEIADRNSARAGSAMERPVFLFVRDSASGMDLALWDCERVQRPSTSQCLPANGPSLARLMRDR